MLSEKNISLTLFCQVSIAFSIPTPSIRAILRAPMDVPDKPVILSYKPYWISAFITPSWYAPFAPPPLRTKAKFSIQSPS